MINIGQNFNSRKIAVCTIKFNDSDEIETQNIALFGEEYGTDIDDDIFFYAENDHVFINLFKLNNGEDFQIISIKEIIEPDKLLS